MSATPRGRVLRIDGAGPAIPVSHGAAAEHRGTALALVLMLPMFAGLFVYVVDVKALYGLAKVWPLVIAPLTLVAAWRLRPGYQPVLLVVCAWLLGATPLIGVSQLGNDAVGALASSVKVWPLTGALGGAAALWFVNPSEADLRRAVMMLSAATFAFLIGAWFLAPEHLFHQTIEDTKVFLSDPERGRRINAPMMFAILGLFVVNRAFWRRPAAWKAAAVLVGLVAMVLFYKQRAQIAGSVAVLGLAAALSLGRWRTPALMIGGALGLAGLIPATLWLGDRAVDSLGGSLTMRQIEAEAAVRFLNDAPWRWITGVGSATRVGDVTLGDIVGTPFFFPSDLGWLGVVFEYGLIGAALMLALHLVAIRMAWTAASRGGDLARAVFDYAVFLLVVSPVVSVVLAPGELATVLALSFWLRTLQARPYDASGSAP